MLGVQPTAEAGAEVCVECDCFTDVRVVDEFNTEEPDARHLKCYAPGIGKRIGWLGREG